MALSDLQRRMRRRGLTAAELHSLMDPIRGEAVTFREFVRGVQASGLRPAPTEHELHKLFAALDLDEDRTIGFKAVCAALRL
jgi:Ca2+-binding EF-hand superfamily protein